MASTPFKVYVQTAITETGLQVRELTDAHPEFREIAKRMRTEWDRNRR